MSIFDNYLKLYVGAVIVPEACTNAMQPTSAAYRSIKVGLKTRNGVCHIMYYLYSTFLKCIDIVLKRSKK